LSEHDAAELAGPKAPPTPSGCASSRSPSAADGELGAVTCPATERSQPTVSHHLALLVAAEVLEREQRGKWAWYLLRPARLRGSPILAPAADQCRRRRHGRRTVISAVAHRPPASQISVNRSVPE
jgi:DNA-binding transcriptional ArsR family regulator